MGSSDFAGRLMPNERIVWTGQPAHGLRLTKRDGLLIPFSLLWCGFVVFWEWSVVRSGAPIFMKIFGAAFLCVGLFFTIGRFFLDAWLRRNISYALTNQRLLILRTGLWAEFTAVGPARMAEARLTERADGTGTVRVGPDLAMFSRSQGSFSMWTPSLDPTPQLIGIPQARDVFNQIQKLASGHREG